MWLTINYKKYIYHHSRVGLEDNLCLCPVLLLTICQNTPAITIPALPPEDDVALLQIETEFADFNTGHVLVIHGVYNDHVEAEIIEPLELNGNMVLYASHTFIAQCIRRYN